MSPNPHFSPVRLSSSDSCLLSIRYDNLLTMSSLQTALDAFIASIPLLTTCRACPCESRGAGSGRNPAGGYRRANRLSCRFVSLVFLMRSVPGAPPTGTLRVSKSVPDGFVPPAGTCSLRPSPCLQPAEPAPAKAGGQALGATLRAAVAVQIVCPDNLSLNHSYGYAFGRRHPLRAQICQEQIWTSAGRPVRHGGRTSKIRRDHRINW